MVRLTIDEIPERAAIVVAFEKHGVWVLYVMGANDGYRVSCLYFGRRRIWGCLYAVVMEWRIYNREMFIHTDNWESVL